ncbi:glycoside hydrolase family protein [Amorphus orientalis]|uniref:Lysozyme n=1 Tax=Amorphus orientalis TaxID=649198 RepID=A0AAE3VMP3_9HYPH|nr:glycoside hydrolase family protein [Amorphus orientalis]MDQ0314867.1 GH24 family phage-related lysozyme (muramidase) [Amorphus orientalis]
MKTSDRGVAFIAAHEGVVLKAYPDPATGGEPWTIGVGHTSRAGPPSVRPGMTITRGEAFEILEADLAVFERAVSSAVTVPLRQHEFDALVSFTFNLGAGNLRKSTLLRKLNAGDKAGAAGEFHKWNRAAGRVMRGLTRRRAEEAALFRHGDYAGAVPMEDEAEAHPDRFVPSLLVRGSTGEAVREVQRTLKGLGYDIGPAGADGIYGADTGAAVRAFQGDHGLTVDGKMGTATRTALEASQAVPPPPDVEPTDEASVAGSALQALVRALFSIFSRT